MARPTTKQQRKIFHATMQVTRIEQWFVEADNADEARALLENSGGHRAHIGECIHFEIDNLVE